MSPRISDLAELENEDDELVPEILPVDARLSVRGPSATFQSLFDRAAAVTPAKEIISGTGFALLEAFSASPGTTAYVKVSATDGDLTVSMVADGVSVTVPGSVLVPGKKIAEILRLAPTEQAKIEVLGTTATIRSGRAQWTVQTPVGHALPPAADVSAITTYSLAVGDLLDALTVARRAASTSSARASLMQLAVSQGSITGLDGGRLHRQRVQNLPAALRATIPLRVSEEVIRMLRATGSETVEMGSSDSHLVFRVDQDTLIAQRLLVDFPDVESQVLGPVLTNTWALTVDRDRLLQAIRRVRVNADPDYQALFVSLVPGRVLDSGMTWNLSLSARDRSGNSAAETLDASWSGPATSRSLCVNHRYLSDLLAATSGEFVTLRIGEDSKAVRLPVLIEDTASGFLGWVQQMRPGYLT